MNLICSYTTPMTEVYLCPMNTVQMPISFYTDKDTRYFDNLGRELFVDYMYILALNISVPYICYIDDVTNKKSFFELPELNQIQPDKSGKRRWSKTRMFRKCLPEAVSRQYWTAEMLGITGMNNNRLIEGGVIISELLRRLMLKSIILE